EMLCRLPHRVVEKHPASADPAVKLSRNKPRLSLHPRRVGRPRVHQLLGVVSLNHKGVDQYDRRHVLLHLPGQRQPFIHLSESRHYELPSSTTPSRRSDPIATMNSMCRLPIKTPESVLRVSTPARETRPDPSASQRV